MCIMATIRFLTAISSAIVVCIVGVLSAQTPESLAFEVASIKYNKSGSDRSSSFVQPGGRYMATNVTLRMLLRSAYGVHDVQITGGPRWISSDRFDIVAKVEGNPPTAVFRDRARLMLRTLLADRFKLTLHHEIRQLPIYALVIASREGKLGPQLRPSDPADCLAADQAPTPAGSGGPGDSNAPLPCGGGFSRPGHLAARATVFSTFVPGLSNWVDRIVLDRTGLKGTFDWTLQGTPEYFPNVESPNAAERSAAGDRPLDSGVSLFTALQEQLGLKLDSQKGPVDTLVD